MCVDNDCHVIMSVIDASRGYNTGIMMGIDNDSNKLIHVIIKALVIIARRRLMIFMIKTIIHYDMSLIMTKKHLEY